MCYYVRYFVSVVISLLLTSHTVSAKHVSSGILLPKSYVFGLMISVLQKEEALLPTSAGDR